MTNEELKQTAIRLSGRPPCKNKLGKGAFRWLADELGVHQSTMSRWVRGPDNGGSKIPEYWEGRIKQLERDACGQYDLEQKQLHVR